MLYLIYKYVVLYINNAKFCYRCELIFSPKLHETYLENIWLLNWEIYFFLIYYDWLHNHEYSTIQINCEPKLKCPLKRMFTSSYTKGAYNVAL